MADAPDTARALDTVCRQWPFDPDILLAAAAFPVASAAPERRLRTVVAMIDAASGEALAQHARDQDEDAGFTIEDGSLRLDTARYDLRPGVRAFGLVVHNASRNPSCPEGGADPVLTLLVRDGNRLRPVFETPLAWWALVDGEVCTPHWVVDSTRLTLGIEPTHQHGFADLSLRTTTTRRTSRPEDTDERALGSDRTHVRFDGQRYVAP